MLQSILLMTIYQMLMNLKTFGKFIVIFGLYHCHENASPCSKGCTSLGSLGNSKTNIDILMCCSITQNNMAWVMAGILPVTLCQCKGTLRHFTLVIITHLLRTNKLECFTGLNFQQKNLGKPRSLPPLKGEHSFTHFPQWRKICNKLS